MRDERDGTDTFGYANATIEALEERGDIMFIAVDGSDGVAHVFLSPEKARRFLQQCAEVLDTMEMHKRTTLRRIGKNDGVRVLAADENGGPYLQVLENGVWVDVGGTCE